MMGGAGDKVEGGAVEKMADTKHLEFLQAAIARMAGHSFLAKEWSVSLSTALLGFAAKESAGAVALVGLLPVAIFWALDAYYLALERGFRDLFAAAVAVYGEGGRPSFAMDPGKLDPGKIFSGLVRPAVWMVHAPLAAALVIAWRVLR